MEPKALDVLLALLRRAGRLVTRRELLDLVWPESFVEEGILAVHVSALRKALGDRGGRPRLIETVARSGYRFVGTISEREALAKRWSIAVLPARPFSAEILSGPDRASGLTLADAVIDRLGRFRQIVVRPTRAVQGYANAEEKPAVVGRSPACGCGARHHSPKNGRFYAQDDGARSVAKSGSTLRRFAGPGATEGSLAVSGRKAKALVNSRQSFW